MAEQALIPRDDTVTAGTTAVELSPETGEKRRQCVVITNTSIGGQYASLAWGKDAVAGKGIVLLPGEHHVEAIDAAFKPLNSRITVIGSAAGATIAIHERLEQVF